MSKINAVCKFILTDAGCRAGSSCRFRHDAFKCLCGASVLDGAGKGHLYSKIHRDWQKNAAGSSAVVPAAESSVPAPEEEKEKGEEEEEEYRTEKCKRCKKIVAVEKMEEHRAVEHELPDKIRKLKIELAKAEDDREGMTVDFIEGIDFGVVNTGTAEGKSLNINRTEARGSVRLVQCSMRSCLKEDPSQSPFSATIVGKGDINVRNPRSVIVVFFPTYDGRYEDTLELVFAYPHGTQFIITRRVCGIAGSREDQEVLKPEGPYKKEKYIPPNTDGPVVPTSHPPGWSGIRWVNFLPKFDPPKALIETAFQSSRTASLKAAKRIMPTTLDLNTYGAWFRALLYIEGEQKQRNLDRLYTLNGVEIIPNNTRYQVEGITNGRPSVLVGDYIHARISGDPQASPWYQGRVQNVVHDVIHLHFSDKFKSYKGCKYDAQFIYNRIPERRKHQAVTTVSKPMRILFPEKGHITYDRVTPIEIQTVCPINREIKDNYEQRETLAAILKQPPGSVPFIIFGPPGTGKTVTIVEAMRQLLLLDTEVRILACAPSNTAADIIAERLTTLGNSQLFRLNSLSRRPEELKAGLETFTLRNGNNGFNIPPVEELRKYRIIVSTCISAGVLWGIGIRKGHFTHVFVDETGQAQEPEVMVPFSTLADENTNLVLAGDHKQLGPEVDSAIANSYGLQRSYLSRLMEKEVYDIEFGRGRTVVKLLENFRSHPSILHFSNKEFYESELRACGNPMITHSLETIDILPTKRFPIVFHGIVGKDQRERSSPSFFNIEEATTVKKYCYNLIADRKKGIRIEHIGVITPYHSQKCKIQLLLSREPILNGIKVGSVDEFQGQERRVIILSTVRSTPDHVALDMRRSLGFVANPFRFNVAMTRAQALLIVVGNPVVLSLDPLWRSFLNYVHERGGWRGTGLTWDPREPVEDSDKYDVRYRQRAEADMEDAVTRMREIVSQNLRRCGVNGTGEGNASDHEEYLGEKVKIRDDE